MAAITFDDLDVKPKSGAITFDDIPAQGQDMGAGRATLQGFNETVPYGNRITAAMGAGIASLATGEPYSDLYNEARANQQATAEASPNAGLAGNALGIAATLPVGFSRAVSSTPVLGTAANALQKASTATGNFVRGGGVATNAGLLAKSANLAGQSARGAVVAAPAAALYGAGAAPEGQQIQGATTGAMLGAGIGGSIPLAGAAIGSAVGYGADKVARYIGSRTGEIPKSALSAPLQKVYDRLRADYPDPAEFQSVLASLGSSKDKALIQSAGARTTNLAKGAAQYPTGEAKATEFFNQATDAAPDKLKSALSKTVSPSTNYSDDVDALLEVGRAKADPLYKFAYQKNKSVDSPEINRLLSTPAGTKALKDSVNIMRNEGKRVAMSDADLVEQARLVGAYDPSTGGIGRGLNLETLDYTKRALDKAYKESGYADKSILSVKNDLLGELDIIDKSGSYAKARGIAGDYLSTKSAMEQGLDFLKDDTENISRRMANMSSAEKEAYRAGVVKALRNDIDNKYDGQNVARLFDKASNRSKLKDLLSGKDYAKLIDEAKAADNIYKLRNQIVGGSPTAGKQLAAQEFQSGLNDIAMDVATGNPLGAGYKAAKKIVSKMFDGISDKSAGEVADILYTKDPKEKYRIIKQLLNESQKSGDSLRSTQAAQKLQAFYRISDALVMKPTPLKLTITPKDK